MQPDGFVVVGKRATFPADFVPHLVKYPVTTAVGIFEEYGHD
jgi:hypothetical protein